MLSIQAGIKTPAAVSPNYLLGACLWHAFSFLIIALIFLLPYATPRATLDFFTSTAQRICAINTGKDKNSCRSFAKLSAWCCVPLARFFFLNIALTFLLPYATPRATLDFFTYAQRICAINTGRDKNSCRSFAKLSAWCVPLARFLFCHR